MSLFRVIFWNSSSNSSQNGRYGKEQEEKERRNLSNSNKPVMKYVGEVTKIVVRNSERKKYDISSI